MTDKYRFIIKKLRIISTIIDSILIKNKSIKFKGKIRKNGFTHFINIPKTDFMNVNELREGQLVIITLEKNLTNAEIEEELLN